MAKPAPHTRFLTVPASAISAVNKRLDKSLDAFANRPLAEPFPYLILDARYEKVRDGGVVMSQAVLIAIGIDWDGRRRFWLSTWPTGKAARRGRTSFSDCVAAASTASSSSSPTITPAFAPPSARF